MINSETLLESIKQYEGPKNGQFNQDVYALAINGFKRNGFFVEFGALNGVTDSNTYVLEKNYGWGGILCEPGKGFQTKLKESRIAKIDFRAVYNESNKILDFKEMKDYTGLSGLENHNYEDMHSDIRRMASSSTYPVMSVSLNDLLYQHGAPEIIDYMSVDTEGSEPVILEAFDFSKYVIRFMTVEHNHNQTNKQKVREVMLKNGYQLIFEDLSGIDDYFVHAAL